MDGLPAIGAEADVPEWSVAHLFPGSVVTLIKRVLPGQCSKPPTIILSAVAPDENVVVSVLAHLSPYHGKLPSGSALETANLSFTVDHASVFIAYV